MDPLIFVACQAALASAGPAAPGALAFIAPSLGWPVVVGLVEVTLSLLGVLLLWPERERCSPKAERIALGRAVSQEARLMFEQARARRECPRQSGRTPALGGQPYCDPTERGLPAFLEDAAPSRVEAVLNLSGPTVERPALALLDRREAPTRRGRRPPAAQPSRRKA